MKYVTMPKPIRLKARQIIGVGSFGTVYRISPRRVVKVFHAEWDQEYIIRDEITGSSKHELCLPVLKVVDVEYWKDGHLKKTKGLLKRYIPIKADHRDAKVLRKRLKGHILWDLWDKNLRKDTKGNIYIVDTQWCPQ
jgi:hypothetical protein